jgi:energy-coupling factor transporter ATP-binding protein EcfA2
MSIMFIGDRAVGKTTLIYELAAGYSSRDSSVRLLSPEISILEELVENGTTVATSTRGDRDLKIEVNLPNGLAKTLDVNWVDTPGEYWESQRQQDSRQSVEQMGKIVQELQTVKAVFLVIAPHQVHIDDGRIHFNKADILTDDPQHQFLSYLKWENNFKWWLTFLKKNITNSQHVIICLNKADLFCNCEHISTNLPFKPENLDVYEIQSYVLNKFFEKLVPCIEEYNQNAANSLVLFITSVKNRVLLEAPWVYIARKIR